MMPGDDRADGPRIPSVNVRYMHAHMCEVLRHVRQGGASVRVLTWTMAPRSRLTPDAPDGIVSDRTLARAAREKSLPGDPGPEGLAGGGGMSYQDSTDPELQEDRIWLSSNVIKASGGRHGGSGGSRIEVQRMAKAYCEDPELPRAARGRPGR